MLYFFMLLLNSTIFRHSFFRGIIDCVAPLYSGIDGQFPGYGKHMHSTWDFCGPGYAFWLYWGLLFIYSSSCWQLFSSPIFFFSSSNNNFLFLFPRTGQQYWSIFDVVAHKLWTFHRLIAFISRIGHYNHRSLMNLANHERNLHVPPIFSTSSSPFTLQVVGNKAKGQISNQVFQENKARHDEA